MRHSRIALCVSLIACAAKSWDQTAARIRRSTARTDGAVADGQVDAVVDGGASDVAPESGPKYPPAVWSLAVDHAGYADGDWWGPNIGVVVQGGPGLKAKSIAPALTQDAAVSIVYAEDGGLQTFNDFNGARVIEVNAVQDAHGPSVQATLIDSPGGHDTKALRK